MIPGGQGTRLLVNHCAFLAWLTKLIDDARFCLSICTGAALVAATSRLNGKTATSNKAAFQWVKQTNNQVNWQQTARWVRDGKFYSSSGVSAGMDMALGFIRDQYGEALATQIAIHTEYHWNQDPNKDDFAARYC